MNGRDFLAILAVTLIVLGILVNAIFLWLALIVILLQLGAYFS